MYHHTPHQAKGGKFMILTLDDLEGTSVSLFVFSKAFDAFWKIQEGSVLCVAGPKVLPRREVGTARDEMLLSDGAAV